MSASEWPSAAKLQDLREKGEVAFSSIAQSCLFILTFIAVLVFSADPLWKKLLISFSSEPSNVVEQVGEMFESLFWVLGIAIFSALVVATIFGLFQTKFLFRWAFVSPSLGRLWKFNRGWSGCIFRFVARLVTSLILAVIATVLTQRQISVMLGHSKLSGTTFVESFLAFLRFELWLICLISLVIGLLAFVVAKFMFLWRHRMTRAEIERELGSSSAG